MVLLDGKEQVSNNPKIGVRFTVKAYRKKSMAFSLDTILDTYIFFYNAWALESFPAFT